MTSQNLHHPDLQVNDLAHSDSGIRVGRVVEVELVEKLREPQPEAVVAKLDGEVDDHHDHGVTQEGGGEKLLGLVNGLQHHYWGVQILR